MTISDFDKLHNTCNSNGIGTLNVYCPFSFYMQINPNTRVHAHRMHICDNNNPIFFQFHWRFIFSIVILIISIIVLKHSISFYGECFEGATTSCGSWTKDSLMASWMVVTVVGFVNLLTAIVTIALTLVFYYELLALNRTNRVDNDSTGVATEA